MARTCCFADRLTDDEVMSCYGLAMLADQRGVEIERHIDHCAICEEVVDRRMDSLLAKAESDD